MKKKFTKSSGLFWPLFILNSIYLITTNTASNGPFDDWIEKELGEEKFTFKQFIRDIISAIVIIGLFLIWFKLTNK